MILRRLPLVSGGIALFAVVLWTGCSTTRSKEIRLRSPRQIKAYSKKAREPRAFFFAIRADDDGRPIFVDAHRQSTDHTVVLPFVSPRGRVTPVIQARSSRNGPTYRALVDSTAAENWTALDREHLLNLTPILVNGATLGTSPGHVEDPIKGILSASPVMMLDTLRMETVLLYARTAEGPLWPLSRSPVIDQVDAVLGAPFLQSFDYVQWDFPRREMIFSAAQSYEPDPEVLLATLPVLSLTDGLKVTASLDGTEQAVLLDTAGDFAVAMENPPGALLPQLRLGKLVTRQVQAVPSQTLNIRQLDVPRIGMEWLSAYRVTLDNHRGVVFIESP